MYHWFENIFKKFGKHPIGQLFSAAMIGAIFVPYAMRFDRELARDTGFTLPLMVFFGAIAGIAAAIPLVVLTKVRRRNSSGELKMKLIDYFLLIGYIIFGLWIAVWAMG